MIFKNSIRVQHKINFFFLLNWKYHKLLDCEVQYMLKLLTPNNLLHFGVQKQRATKNNVLQILLQM